MMNLTKTFHISFFELNDQFSYIIKASDLPFKTYLVTGNDKLLDANLFTYKIFG